MVFSIDGSFAASVSIMGSDPKVRAGAVDVVRSVAWERAGGNAFILNEYFNPIANIGP